MAKPDAPTASATANGGEIRISWNPVPGAQYYTVGWVNWTEAQPLSNAGQDWLHLFNYTTVPGNVASHTVKGLNGGEDHYAIIRATDGQGVEARFGGGWSPFSEWSLATQPAGQHGAGFCPITGLPLGDEGYLSVGASTTHAVGQTFTLNSIAKQATIRLGDSDYPPFTGRQYIKTCGTVQAPATLQGSFFSGKDYHVDSDSGLGFAALDTSIVDWLDVGLIPQGQTRSACEVWDVPASANTVIVAVNNWQSNPALYRIELADVTTTSTSTSTSTNTTTTTTTPLTSQQLTSLVKPALGQIIATNSHGETGSGTGFVVRSDGLMVTNRHVVDDADTVTVYMQNLDGDLFEYTGTVLGRGILADLAVVQLPSGRTYNTLDLADSDAVSGVDEVTAWGYPGGSISGTYPTITRGIISSKGIRGDVDFLQTDAAINPGNSGGPLIDQYGQVVGVNTLKTVSERVDNQGFAIASNEVSNRLNTLINGGLSNETYHNIKNAYGYSVDIPKGWYLDREGVRRTTFYPYHNKGWSRVRMWNLADSFVGSSDKLADLAEWRWNDSLPHLSVENKWTLFEPISFSEIGAGSGRHYRVEYRRQDSADYCISNRVEIIALSSSDPANLGFSMMGSVCELNITQYRSQRDAILNSFRP